MTQILAGRAFLEAVFGLAVLVGRALADNRKGSSPDMAKDIVMVHGANEGGWCFAKFKGVFEGLGFTCHAPDLIGHGSDATAAKTRLVGVGMGDYLAQLRTLLKNFDARATASAYPGSTFWQLDDHGHMLVLEPGAEDIARRIASWIPS
jgi:alpha-beta hydrolase superfamily lysophospholipase